MGRLKTFRKYIIWFILFYLFSSLMIYIGLNATYKNIDAKEDISCQIKIDLAQATKVNGRIFGEVTSSDENNLEGKYIKVQIYTKKGNLAGVKFMKIENTTVNEPKKFVTYFTAENIASYTVDIVDDSEETQNEIISVANLFKDVFTNEELQKTAVITFILYCIFA